MKLRILLVVLMVAAFASSASAAAPGPYLGGSLGVSIVHDTDIHDPSGNATFEYDPGFAFNIAGGYNFEPGRLEAEFGYKNADVSRATVGALSGSVSGTDITVLSYMFNGYYDFKLSGTPVTPFVGAGLGILHGELDVQGSKGDDTVFGYQFMLGAGYKVNRNITLDLSYRFQGAASDFSESGTSFSYNSSNILFGMRYNF
ncbi:outer membrane channel protein [Geomonas limicola]|uniref:Outer membrane channel protein n=1 Tax=Geomonas limicola TaxID=2740186 RepID=A0A6V8NFI9_9BACT|nr:outer membrane beta-barrel protein [Geomonas limicola]GFO70557.1 outer membrane channel protein [Geomonas limicola]